MFRCKHGSRRIYDLFHHPHDFGQNTSEPGFAFNFVRLV